MLLYRHLVVPITLNILGLTIPKNEDKENNVTEALLFDERELDSQGTIDRMISSQTTSNPEYIENESAELNKNTLTIGQISFNQTKTELTNDLELKEPPVTSSSIDNHETNDFRNTQDSQIAESKNGIETSNRFHEDVESKNEVKCLNHYCHDGLVQNYKSPINQTSSLFENESNLMSNTGNTPDILMDTREKDYLKQRLNANATGYYCNDDCPQTVSSNKRNQGYRPESSNTSLDFITISEWNEQEDEERFRHHLANNPPNPNPFDNSSENEITKSDISEKENELASEQNENQSNDKSGIESDEQTKEKDENKDNELTVNNRDVLSPNATISSTGRTNCV